MANERRTVQVFADWESLGGPRLMGRLHSTPSRGKAVFSFEYESAWLQSGEAQRMDPKLDLFSGPQYPTSGHDNFGVFLDSCPDRWGRTLLERREAQLAREQARRPRPLYELDFLLGVYDGHRLGALRFRVGDGPFLDDNQDLASPPWTSLRELEQASLLLEGEHAEDDPSYGKWLRLLIAPGRSLGGARPKASVQDPDGHLWIAKFPSRDDTHDVGAWESVVHALAKKAGIETSEGLCRRFGSRHHTFLSKRFDRSQKTSRRIHFASAMTMLERRDGEEASYLDLAEVLHRQGAHPARDLAQLWRRIVFFVCVSNVDDHLRNHGFLLEKNGWSLSPAYDMNPVVGGSRALNISATDNAQDLELVREVAKYFRVEKKAKDILSEVKAAVRTWRAEAEAAGIARSEQARMAPAFELADE